MSPSFPDDPHVQVAVVSRILQELMMFTPQVTPNEETGTTTGGMLSTVGRQMLTVVRGGPDWFM